MINSALGFDSYLVMRHGHGVEEEERGGGGGRGKVAGTASATTTATTTAAAATATATDDGHRLGCYFCNDIMAAANSQHDRTLDQQCTVTRPGLSFIAAALAVEMMVALLHSPQGARHPAPEEAAERGDCESEAIPHQIRGSLAGFSQMALQTAAFDCCTSCSKPVVEALRTGGVGFVRTACADPKSLEVISGAAALMSAVELDAQCEGLLDDEDDF